MAAILFTNRSIIFIKDRSISYTLMLSRDFCLRVAAPVGSLGLARFLILFLFLALSSCTYLIDEFLVKTALDIVNSIGIQYF